MRTFQRRLEQEGLTYQRLVDQVRFQAAAELLGNRSVKMIEIALELGYSDAAHFTRAFRRWTGVEPSEFRRLCLKGSGTAFLTDSGHAEGHQDPGH